MKNKQIYIIDFDNTFVNGETFEVFADLALPEQRDEVLEITNQAMAGKMKFSEALRIRLKLMRINKDMLQDAVEELKRRVTPSFKRNMRFFKQNAEQIYIVSGGFKDLIVPVVKEFGIQADHIFANEFIFDKSGNVKGVDEENFLAQNGGKVKQVENLGLKDAILIGDGYTDYEVFEAGSVKDFYVFTENIQREEVLKKAEKKAASFDEVLFDLKATPRDLSFPKSRIKVLLLENIHESAKEYFEREGYQVELLEGALNEEELVEKIKDVAILGVRSKTEVTEKVIDAGKNLLAVAAFCIGTNQINLDAALKRGVAVFNAPFSNTRSVVEMTLGEIIILMRRIFEKSMDMHQGKWRKTAVGCYEVRGKKLGIVGYGNIGMQISVLAEAIGMKVYYYDLAEKMPMGNTRKCDSLEELFAKVDIVSVHVAGGPKSENIIREEHFKVMKDGAFLINMSRGSVVDEKALVKYLKNGKIAGAAVDVFSVEPKTNCNDFKSDLIGLPNVILTPHIGGSTEEAQTNIAEFVYKQIVSYVNQGSTQYSVNFPRLNLPELQNGHRIIHFHKNIPGILAEINEIFAKRQINILAQYLKTSDQVGYVIVDVDQDYDQKVFEELRDIEGTIRFRVLY